VDSSPAGSVLDADAALARLGGDRQLFTDMAGFFYEDGPQLMGKLRRAADEKDAAAVRMNAHALKGLVAGCGGVRATNVAQKVETAGQQADLKNIAALVESLDIELKQLTQALRAYCD
jgi:HPt (histidine-containing phosphotransfer) domain-containing protein